MQKNGRWIQYKASRALYESASQASNIYTLWYFAELAVARRLRAAFFG
jgi:hypothetical protein